jgi:hypothetical protein
MVLLFGCKPSTGQPADAGQVAEVTRLDASAAWRAPPRQVKAGCDEFFGKGLWPLEDPDVRFLIEDPRWGPFFSGAFHTDSLAAPGHLEFSLYFPVPPRSRSVPLALPAPFTGEVELLHSTADGPVCGKMVVSEDDDGRASSLRLPGVLMRVRVHDRQRLRFEGVLSPEVLWFLPWEVHGETLGVTLSAFTEVPPRGAYDRRDWDKFKDELQRLDRCRP